MTETNANDPIKWSLKNLLCISTEHICQSTHDMLEAESLQDSGGMSSAALYPAHLSTTVGRYGDFAWFMWVPGAGQHVPFPADLAMIFEYARSRGCEYLLIEVDGHTLPDLPVYPNE